MSSIHDQRAPQYVPPHTQPPPYSSEVSVQPIATSPMPYGATQLPVGAPLISSHHGNHSHGEMMALIKRQHKEMLLLSSNAVFLSRLSAHHNSISVSGQHDGKHGADRSLLHSRGGDGASAWWPNRTDVEHRIQVDLGQTYTVLAVRIQGSAECQQWVKRVRIQVAVVNGEWTAMTNAVNGDEYFAANYDQNSVVTHILGDGTVKARMVSLVVGNVYGLDYYAYPSLRWDVVHYI